MAAAITPAQLRHYLLAKPAAEETFPFRPDVPVYQVAGKIFALSFVKNGQAHLNLKCEPSQAEILRSLFTEISAGYHMHKKHWNTLDLEGELPACEIYRLIDHSYDLITQRLPKSTRQHLALQHASLVHLADKPKTPTLKPATSVESSKSSTQNPHRTQNKP